VPITAHITPSKR